MSWIRLRKMRKWLVLAVNIVGVILISIFFILYNQSYKNRLYNQNIDDISNLNQTSAAITEAYFSAKEQHLADMAKYIEYNQFTIEEAIAYLRYANSDKDEQYQLVGTDYLGLVVQSGKKDTVSEIDYSNHNYSELQSIILQTSLCENAEVVFVPEFTNDLDGVKCFALQTGVKIRQSDGSSQKMSLMSVSRSENFINQIQFEGGYEGMSTIIIDHLGNYIISDSGYQSENFFQYLYVFNGLSLDQKNQLVDQFKNSTSGYFEFLNSKEQECVFFYRKISNSDWYSLSAIPVEAFHYLFFDYQFTILTLVVLLSVFVVDITWLQHLNGRMKTMMEKEQKANSTKSEFLSRMSHDIRTPMNAILGLTQLGYEETDDHHAKEYFGKILSSASYLLSLLNDILDMSKMESGHVTLHEEVVNCKNFFYELSELLTPMIKERGLTINYVNNIEDVEYLYCDRVRIKQIYLNLLSNAIKFSNQNGTIDWIVNKNKEKDGRIYFDVIVRDYGCGMSEDFMKRIFRPFEQEKNEFSNEKAGTGLGLAICKNLVVQMGGTIRVESKLSEGSTFTVSLSHKIAQSPELEKTETVYIYEKLKGKNILLVEDNELNTEIAKRILEKREMEVTCAENGKIAIELFCASENGYYDAILMDIRMPVLDGLSATRQIRLLEREDAKHVPIIAMTADAYESERKQGFEAGMSDYLSKPIDTKLLLETLEQQISQRIS